MDDNEFARQLSDARIKQASLNETLELGIEQGEEDHAWRMAVLASVEERFEAGLLGDELPIAIAFVDDLFEGFGKHAVEIARLAATAVESQWVTRNAESLRISALSLRQAADIVDELAVAAVLSVRLAAAPKD